MHLEHREHACSGSTSWSASGRRRCEAIGTIVRIVRTHVHSRRGKFASERVALMVRRFDPERRDRIIDAAIDCIAAEGVAGTSHRKVALRADVPLGSMTYHFANMDELLIEAFSRFTATIAEAFEQRMRDIPDADAVLDAVVDLIHVDLQRSNREQVLTYELYTLAARQAQFRIITNQWMLASRRALGRHFPPDIARILDAYIEGAAMHIALDTEPQDRALTRAALDSLAAVAAVRPESN